jgi:hypothetical protein
MNYNILHIFIKLSRELQDHLRHRDNLYSTKPPNFFFFLSYILFSSGVVIIFKNIFYLKIY